MGAPPGDGGVVMETITTYGVGPDQPTYNQLREQNRVLREALRQALDDIPGWVMLASDALTATSQPIAAEVHQRMFDHGDATSQEGQG